MSWVERGDNTLDESDSMQNITIWERYDLAKQADDLSIKLDNAFVWNWRNMKQALERFASRLDKQMAWDPIPDDLKLTKPTEWIRKDIWKVNSHITNTRVNLAFSYFVTLWETFKEAYDQIIENHQIFDPTRKNRQHSLIAEAELYKKYELFDQEVWKDILPLDREQEIKNFVTKYQNAKLDILKIIEN